MGATNMSIQTTSEPSYMDRPKMQQTQHPEHEMPSPEYDGMSLPAKMVK